MFVFDVSRNISEDGYQRCMEQVQSASAIIEMLLQVSQCSRTKHRLRLIGSVIVIFAVNVFESVTRQQTHLLEGCSLYCNWTGFHSRLAGQKGYENSFAI